MPTLENKIPASYHHFLSDLVKSEVPEEKVATCNNCVMTLSPKSTNIDTKCCVYHAELPNYLLGGLLQDGRESLQEGKKRAKEIIASKLGVSPYGIRRPSWYRAFEKTTKQNKEHQMTQSDKETLRCPFYDKGNCTTWAYREHCCSTHFCFSVGGDTGQKFWKSLDKYMAQTEKKLARYIAKELGCTHPFVDKWQGASALRADDESRGVDEAKYQGLWESWNGTEEEFYLASHEKLKEITPQKYMEIMGDNWQNRTEELQDLLANFNSSIIPDYLVWNKETKIEKADDNKVTLTTSTGKCEIGMRKLPILQAFDGQKSLLQMSHLAFKAQASIAKDISTLIEIQVLQSV
ncbi:MAG: Fe-S-cluster containining protein [Flammeovirgaceae bacterium]|jgi:Fe-S-cluster containining protein